MVVMLFRSSMIPQLLAAILGLSSCTTTSLQSIWLKIPDKTNAKQITTGVVAQPHYKVGNPYRWLVNGIIQNDLRYDKTGIASWYVDQFAGKLTAMVKYSTWLISAA